MRTFESTEFIEFYNLDNFCNFSKTEVLRLPDEDEDALKHVGVLTLYNILLICVCIYIYMLCVCWSG